MSQPEPNPYARGAVIADLACVLGEIADMQVRQAEMSARVSRMIRDLSCTTATIKPGADLKELRERLGDVRGRLEATLETVKNPTARTAPAAQAASPPVIAPVAQNEGRPVRVGKASDERSVGVSGIGGFADQSEELRHVAGAGGESAASADTAPAADAKPRRTFPNPLPAKAPELPLARPTAEIHKQPGYKASGPGPVVRTDYGAVRQSGPTTDPMVPRREPQILRAGGGLVQDGGSKTGAPPRPASTKDRVLDLYGETLKGFHEIAREVGISQNSAGPYVSTGRTAKDPRVLKGDTARTAFHSEKVLDHYAAGALSMNEIDRNLRIASGTAVKMVEAGRKAGDPRIADGDKHRAPVTKEPAPLAEPKAATPEPPVTRKVENAIPADAVIAVFDSVMVHGPAGSWKAERNVARALRAIADGQLYGIDHIARAGGFDAKNVVPSLGIWSAALAKIGVDLIHTKGIGVKLNRRAA